MIIVTINSYLLKNVKTKQNFTQIKQNRADSNKIKVIKGDIAIITETRRPICQI